MKKFLIFVLAALCTLCLAGAVACQKTVKLDAPVISLDENVVSWNEVANADSYDVHVGTETVNVTETSYTVTETAAGSYEIYVIAKSSDANYTDSDSSNSVTYTVEEEVETVVLSSITIAVEPTKLVYYLDERADGLDLTGLAVNARYSDRTSSKITVTAENIGSVDLTTAGEKTVTVSYTEDGITKTADFTVTVRERTYADLDEYETYVTPWSADAQSYKISDGTVTAAVDMQGNALQLVGTDGVSAAAFPASGDKLVKITDGEGNQSFVKVVAAIYVSTTADFAAIASNLSGYYILQNDLFFDDNDANAVMIGTAPLEEVQEGEDITYAYDEAGTARGGVPFLGTFDGNGYTIYNYTLAYADAAYNSSAYYLAMFGYVGEGATVCNFTLRNSSVTAGKHGAFIAAVNLGTVRNVVIDDDCTLFSTYTGAGAISAYNGGTIENAVCYVPSAGSNYGSIALTEASASGAAAVNYYNSPAANLAETLGDGWFHIDGVGTVYGNESYKKVLSFDDTMYAGQSAQLRIYSLSEIDITLAAWGLTYTGEEPFTVTFGGVENNVYTYAVTFAEGTDTSVSSFNLGVGLGGGRFIKIISVTVGAPYITAADAVSESLQVVEGTQINLENVQITLTYSDRSETTVAAIRAEGFDGAGEIGSAQSVKFYYGEGENEFVTISVTIIQKEISSLSVSGSYKTEYTVGETLDLSNLTLNISYNNNTRESIPVTAEMIDESSYDMNTASSYEVTVTYGGNTCTFRITVTAAEVRSLR